MKVLITRMKVIKTQSNIFCNIEYNILKHHVFRYIHAILYLLLYGSFLSLLNFSYAIILKELFEKLVMLYNNMC